jgi:hypothetical protein
LILPFKSLTAQVVINEGSNRNYSSIADENGEYPDWIELYNAGTDTVNLLNYSLSDKLSNPDKWIFPEVRLAPGQYKIIFSSGKDRKPVSGFTQVAYTGPFTPQNGWNTHLFDTPFFWDGTSNIVINTCSYCSWGYTSNSVFNQTSTEFLSTAFTAMDGSPASCSAAYGAIVFQRPNMKLNDIIVGTGQVQNAPTDYPAPYGNWYWGARHQMLIRASELAEAGLPPGAITSLAFDVVATDPNTVYDYIDIYMKPVSDSAVSPVFYTVDTNNYLHTSFKISEEGETVYLFSPSHVLLSQLNVQCNDLDISTGSLPDASTDIFLFQYATPSSTNNYSIPYTAYLLPPSFSVPSGFYDETVNVTIGNPNSDPCTIHYTLDGSDPSSAAPVYTGEPVNISGSAVLKAKALAVEKLPSPITAATYFFGVNHETPVLSVITDNANLYGPAGIFDNWWYDWERAAYVEYFDSVHNLVFSQRSGIQIDGGWGGARTQPQHSFRVELDDGVLGDGPISYPMIPDRPGRLQYGKFYLRNGSNQYLVLPHKDACQVRAMGTGTNNYYSAWRPVSVYINGSYFGLYELREKMDLEYFHLEDGADEDQIDILSQSAWYGGVLHAVEGSVEAFIEDYNAYNQLDPSEPTFWNAADQYFDLVWYNDYIIGESWMGNTDWPWNNIKIYRSDATGFRWRFCLMDMELAMAPNGWTDCYFDHIQYMRYYDPANPYINIWLKGIQNDRFRDYFINRFADVMNTAYTNDRLVSVENNMYGLTVGEMPIEYARWGDPDHIPEQMEQFQNNHNKLRSQFNLRTGQVRNHIQWNFNLPNQVDVTLNVFPSGAGKINISTVTPEEYPWQGVYFNGVPVKIEAIPAEGYAFLHWGNNGLIIDTLNPVFLDILNTTATSFDAYFDDLITLAPSMVDHEDFSVYPNPADDILYIRDHPVESGDLKYQIIDVNGRVIMEGIIQNGNNVTKINISPLPVSVFLLRISDSHGMVKQFRFVKTDIR